VNWVFGSISLQGQQKKALAKKICSIISFQMQFISITNQQAFKASKWAKLNNL